MKKENKKLKIVAIIQARMGSTRLPKKALLKIEGKTLIEWIKYRLSFSKEIDQIVLSTADTAENNSLVTLAKKIKLEYFAGSEKDLIGRLLGTALKFKANAIVRITGDCPLVDPKIVDKLVLEFKNCYPNIDYVCNIFPVSFPDGMDVEIVSTETLKRLDREVKDELYREWLTTTIMENPDKFRIANIANKKDLSHLRLTVDYQEDFDLTKILFQKLQKKNSAFSLKDILKLFKKEPALVEINKNRIDKKVINNIRSGAFYELKNNMNKNMDEKYFLKGEKVYLRPYKESDAEFVYQWFNDPVVTYYMFTGQKPKTFMDVKAAIEKDTGSEENTIFITVDIKSGEIVGLVGLYEIDPTARKAEMRIIIGNKNFWGKGYGTEMCDAINFYGFDRLNLNRIYLGGTDENKGGVRAYEKAGYVYEGTLKQDLYRNSRYYNSIRMGILREDYYKKYYPKHKSKFSVK